MSEIETVKQSKLVEEVWPGSQGFRVYRITPIASAGPTHGYVISLLNPPAWVTALGWSNKREYWRFGGPTPSSFDLVPLSQSAATAWLNENAPPPVSGIPLEKFAATANQTISEATIFEVQKYTGTTAGAVIAYFTTNVGESGSDSWCPAGWPYNYMVCSMSQLLRFTKTSTVPAALVRGTVPA